MFAKKEKEDKKRRKNRGKGAIQDEDIPEIAERLGKMSSTHGHAQHNVVLPTQANSSQVFNLVPVGYPLATHLA